mgnify:CR=1 FL=1
MDRDAGGTVMFCLAGCGEKPMTAVYFHTDVTAGILRIWTRTRFSPERYG